MRCFCTIGDGWIYLSFLDDLHRCLRYLARHISWIYLSFLDDLHPECRHGQEEQRWIYLSFLDDLHPIQLK